MLDDTSKRLRILIWIIGVGLLASMRYSWRLWTSDRTFPSFPLFSDFGPFADPFDKIFLGAFVVLVLVLMIRPHRWLVIATLGFMFVFAIQDQERWQPWFYQYGLMLLPFAFCDWRRDNEKGKAILGLAQLIVIMVYIWGGIHKCHSGWMSVWESYLVSPIVGGMEAGWLKSSIIGFGYLIPPIEIITGLGFLFRRTRLIAILFAFATHITILILLGPVRGEISNIVVWPWNLTMVGMVIVLFHKVDTVQVFRFWKVRFKSAGAVICALMLFGPILFYAHLWDRYLSFNLYSGRQKGTVVLMDEMAKEKLPEEWGRFISKEKNASGFYTLSLSGWSYDDLNVPFVSEWRIIRAFSSQLCEYDIGDGQIHIYVAYRHLKDKQARYYRCDEVEEMRER